MDPQKPTDDSSGRGGGVMCDSMVESLPSTQEALGYTQLLK